MFRPSISGTETTVSRLKSLYLYVREAKGPVPADDLLAKLELSANDLANETRPVTMALWFAALQAFVERYGKEMLLETWRGAVHPDNLGVWMRVLRGVTTPEGAFKQLDGLGSDEVRNGRWETLESVAGLWRGRAYMTSDPRFERDGLLALARAAELRGVPALFGFGPGEVKLLTNERHTFASRTGSAFQEYEVAWREETPRRLPRPWAALGAASAGATAGLVSPALGLLGAFGGVAAAAYVSHRGQRSRREQLAQEAQRVRLAALERGTQLREGTTKATVRYEEGNVVAGAYRLGAQLGSGANGVIHAAVRLSDQTPVALKLLRLAVAHDAVASDRLRREAEAMGLAWHPNVVELYDHGMLPDGTAYLVMELLRGESLASRLQRQGKLTSEELLPIALSLCDALGAVHAAGVIHRDLKPSNIFLVDRGDDKPTAVKLLDFGIARVEWAETRITMAGAPVGTPGYMSPEQEGGREGSVDARSDIYALGAVLHECLTGETPRLPRDEDDGSSGRSVTPASGIQRAAPVGSAEGWPATLRAVLAGHPHEPVWAGVLKGSLAKEPRDRFVDARAIKKALAPLDPSAADEEGGSGFARSG